VPLDLDPLFAAPLKTFVAERKRLADDLKAVGQVKEAKEVQKIQRPSVSVWIVNQLARREAPLLKVFAETTARLRGAQRPVAGGQRADDPTEAMAAHREALKRLRARAEEILVASGQAARPQILERVVRNLRVGMASEESRQTIEAGRLMEDVGDEDFLSLLGPPSEAGDAGEPTPPRNADGGSGEVVARGVDASKVRARAEAERVQARAESERVQARAESERVRARAEAERRIRGLRDGAERARRALEKGEREVESARQTLSETEERLRKAQLESELADQALGEAEATLDHRG
jgi:hypothetical protein